MKRFTATLLCLLLAFSALPGLGASKQPDAKTYSSRKHDLDGDGKKDSVKITFSGAEYFDGELAFFSRFTININGQEIKEQGTTLLPPPRFIDIDKGDGHIEILICDDGPSDDPQSFIYGYYDGKIVDLGAVEGHLSNTRNTFAIDGDGTITTPVRSELLQTWWVAMDLRLDREKRQLTVVEQDVYDSVGTYKLTVKKSFTAYRAKADDAKTFTLQKGTHITLDGSDEKQWLRFRDNKGQIGWIRLMDYTPDEDGYWYSNDIKGYGPADDYLDGLEYFD